ncbi:MAG: LCCL domain-containing protein [Elainellaceae cyanobacterium]
MPQSLRPMRLLTRSLTPSLAVLLSLALPASAIPSIPTVTWSDTAVPYEDRVGEDVTLFCPPAGTPAPTWGSDRYSSTSSVCTAAVHAGLITLEEGGAIAIRITPGEAATGSDRNEISTASRGATAASFTFTNPRDFVADVLPTAFGDLPLHPITWSTTASPSWRQTSTLEAYHCPAGGVEPVWGSGAYSQDSSLCTAAVHAGQITLQGGPIVVQRLPGQGYYSGSVANGVRTGDRVGGSGSFRVVEAAVLSSESP